MAGQRTAQRVSPPKRRYDRRTRRSEHGEHECEQLRACETSVQLRDRVRHPNTMELGLYTFAETRPTRRAPGTPPPPGCASSSRSDSPSRWARRLRRRRAPSAGLHRVVARRVLGAIGRARRIRLASAVTVSARRPVRLPGFRDARSSVEWAGGDHGRSWFVHRIVPCSASTSTTTARCSREARAAAQDREDGPVTWSGDHRTPLRNQLVHPPIQHPLPVWIAVGGTPSGTHGRARSADGAGDHRGAPERFAPSSRSGAKRAKPATIRRAHVAPQPGR
jgi:hypothetical protein